VLAQTAVARRLGALSPRFATSFSTASLAVAGLLGRRYPVERAFHRQLRVHGGRADRAPQRSPGRASGVPSSRGPASRANRSLSAASANNLSFSARLLNRNLRNLRRNQENMRCGTSRFSVPISLTAHKTSRESVLPLRTNARPRPQRTSEKGDFRTCQARVARPHFTSQAEGTSNRELRARASSEGGTPRTATRCPRLGDCTSGEPGAGSPFGPAARTR
jgi:hypothetical protein